MMWETDTELQVQMPKFVKISSDPTLTAVCLLYT